MNLVDNARPASVSNRYRMSVFAGVHFQLNGASQPLVAEQGGHLFTPGAVAAVRRLTTAGGTIFFRVRLAEPTSLLTDPKTVILCTLEGAVEATDVRAMVFKTATLVDNGGGPAFVVGQEIDVVVRNAAGTSVDTDNIQVNLLVFGDRARRLV